MLRFSQYSAEFSGSSAFWAVFHLNPEFADIWKWCSVLLRESACEQVPEPISSYNTHLCHLSLLVSYGDSECRLYCKRISQWLHIFPIGQRKVICGYLQILCFSRRAGFASVPTWAGGWFRVNRESLSVLPGYTDWLSAVLQWDFCAGHILLGILAHRFRLNTVLMRIGHIIDIQYL